MHPPDCPSWEYSAHPRKGTIGPRVAAVLKDLATGKKDACSVAVDTREPHRQIFDELTPEGHNYYAGHYRGENFRCLAFCRVLIQGDPRVGAEPHAVAFLMLDLGAEIRAGITALDMTTTIEAKERLRYIVALTCHAFVAFLTIHPYLNGNGHAGRLIVWSILARYGHWPQRWPIDPRPPDPPYSDLIVRYRNGDIQPLEKFILQSLIS